MSYDPFDNDGEDSLTALTILPPTWSNEDIRQERELAKLEGRKPRYIHPMRSREMGYGLVTPDTAESLWTDPVSLFDFEAADQLTEWLFEQSERIQFAVLKYIDEPTEEHLTTILKLLDRHSEYAIEAYERRKASSGSLIDLILRSLPATKEGLYQMARKEHPAKRPEAAVRQALRRLQAEGRIHEEGGRFVRVS